MDKSPGKGSSVTRGGRRKPRLTGGRVLLLAVPLWLLAGLFVGLGGWWLLLGVPCGLALVLLLPVWLVTARGSAGRWAFLALVAASVLFGTAADALPSWYLRLSGERVEATVGSTRFVEGRSRSSSGSYEVAAAGRDGHHYTYRSGRDVRTGTTAALVVDPRGWFRLRPESELAGHTADYAAVAAWLVTLLLLFSTRTAGRRR